MNQQISQVIKEQMFVNRSINFLFESFPDNVIIADKVYKSFKAETEEFVKSIQALDRETVEEFSCFMAKKSINLMVFNNQYLCFKGKDEEALVAIYKTLLKKLRDLALSEDQSAEVLIEIIQRHHMKLRDFLIATNPEEMAHIRQEDKVVEMKVCSEYTFEFQVNILGLDLDHLKGPVLDVGCGRSGHLLKSLREMGYEAYGIERINESESPFIISSNWLEYKVEESHWGTIISNMAFSNHFYRAYAIGSGDIEAYHNKYLEFLRGLKVGGKLIYAPGLKKVESTLGDAYDIQRIYPSDVIDPRLYTAHITRLK